MLRLSLDAGSEGPELPLRKGRAIGWFEEALTTSGSRLSRVERHRLAIAIRSAVGIESLVWLTDVAGFSREEAAHFMQWSAQALLHHALTAGLPQSSPPS